MEKHEGSVHDTLRRVIEEQEAEIERLQTLFGERFRLDAVCSSCDGPLDVDRDSICRRCTDADVSDMDARIIARMARENERLRANVDRINPEVDGQAIDARDAAWNLYRGAVSKSRAVEIWPWLAEYEAAEKAMMK